jgi:hypothetical protein
MMAQWTVAQVLCRSSEKNSDEELSVFERK